MCSCCPGTENCLFTPLLHSLNLCIITCFPSSSSSCSFHILLVPSGPWCPYFGDQQALFAQIVVAVPVCLLRVRVAGDNTQRRLLCPVSLDFQNMFGTDLTFDPFTSLSCASCLLHFQSSVISCLEHDQNFETVFLCSCFINVHCKILFHFLLTS